MSATSTPAAEPASRQLACSAAVSAAAMTVPHALGLGLLAFAPLLALSAAGGGGQGGISLAALALWSAALPGLLLTLVLPRPGVVYAPTTVVALLFAAVLATVQEQAQRYGLSVRQVLAVSGAVVALGFFFQWLIGALRLALLARFLPVSVAHGFAAGVGLSMVSSQVRTSFGAGAWSEVPFALMGWHLLVALLVVALVFWLRQRTPRWPALLVAAVVVSFVILALSPWGAGPGQLFARAAPPGGFSLPLWPQWSGVPWLDILREQGTELVLLAFLMALVNSLEPLVLQQELELEHGVRGDVCAQLRRESVLGALCALAGMIPASSSVSRSRVVLAQAGLSLTASRGHAALMLAVALTGVWWLPQVPMAVLAGALIAAGLLQVPALMWSRSYAQDARAHWAEAWIVALIFATAGGVGALVAGLVVATVALLRASAASVLRHARLNGELRSRRVRSAASEAWLEEHMREVAVFELQGVISFGVASHMVEQVRARLQPRHRRVILDVARVLAWDHTALAQLRALVRDLHQRAIPCAAAGTSVPVRAEIPHLRRFADLDRALEWAEAALLSVRPPEENPQLESRSPLGELGLDVPEDARAALQARLVEEALPAGQSIFESGAVDHDLLIVRSGRVTLATAWPPENGLRFATIGPGMVFGEMAFLNHAPRTAYAGAEDIDAVLERLSRPDFDAWAVQYPAAALQLMNNLAQVGARRLQVTTRQLRLTAE